MTEKIVLIGAGSVSFTRGLIADMLRAGVEGELGLVDVNPDTLDIVEKLAAKMVAAKGANLALSASTDRRDVLPGATAIICTVGVGGRRAWEQDVFIPRKYGIYQPVGDTVGPGGTSRAMRMIPAMVAIAKDVLDLAPNALFFNYGNPMSPVCRAIRKATGAEVVGLCHGVFGVGRYLAHAIGVDPGDFDYTAIGINHLTWFIEARVNGEDAMPRLKAVAEERTKGEDNPLSWHLLKVFGGFPAAMDRHVTEFFSPFLREGTYGGKTLGVDVFSVEATIDGGDRAFARMAELARSPEPLAEDELDRSVGEHEQVVEIIHCLRENRPKVFSANLPNTGQVPNLPTDAVIECPAVPHGGKLRALAQKPLPPGIAGTLATRFFWVETVVDAALEGSREKFIQALLIDGACPSPDVATALADELLAVHREYLPTFDLPS